MTIFHRGLWAWLCATCGAAETGYVAEHHAQVMHDEHALLHRFTDLAGMSVFHGFECPQPVYDPIRAQTNLLRGAA